MIRRPSTRSLTAIIATAMLSACAGEAAEETDAPTGPGVDLAEQAIKVPGFADFLAVDGDTVWVTNDGRVEQWATTGKVASFAVPRPCGTMAIAEGSLWVANCKGAEIYRINLKTAALEAKVATGLANPKGETNVVAGAGSVWVASDPAALTVAGRTKVGDNLKWGDIDAAGGAVWLRTTDDQTLVVIDPATLEIRARMGDAVGSGALRWTPKGVWTSAHDNQTLSWWSAPTAR